MIQTVNDIRIAAFVILSIFIFITIFLCFAAVKSLPKPSSQEDDLQAKTFESPEDTDQQNRKEE